MRAIPEDAWTDGGAVDDALMDVPLITSLAEVVRRTPDAPALADDTRVLSYRELWNAAMVLAAEIVVATVPGDRVGVRLPAGTGYGVAMLACLAAGRVSVALDLADPAARTTDIIRRSQIALAIGEPVGTDKAVWWRPVGPLDTAGPMRAAREPLPSHLPAFIVATSGSTGAPKLIVCSQRGYAASARGTALVYGTTADDRHVFTGSPSAAACAKYLFHGLLTGSMTMMCDIRSVGLNGLAALMATHRATTLRMFVALGRVLATVAQARAAFAHLRMVRVPGEPMLASDVALLRGVLPPSAAIISSYGQTEASVGFEWFLPPGPYRGPAVLPVGRLQPGAAFVLLDDDGRPCPPGVPGVLMLRSRYHAIGEWQDARCMPGRMQPAGPDSDLTIYRTGDLAVVGPDGMVSLLGRADRQVKVNGNRIEPREIEEAMRGIPGVAAAAVVARRDADRTVLLGFIVADPDAPPGPGTAVRRLLAQRLPPAMVPARIIALDRLPFLPGFKLDTAAMLAEADREVAHEPV